MGNTPTKEELQTIATTAGVSEEELLECPVCFQNMLDRQPRALGCLHTFCHECLQQIKDKNYAYSNSICCPTCRQLTTLPPTGIAGLPSNFMFKEFGQKLKDMIGSQKKQSCQKCEGEGKIVAGSRVCLDCGFYLCGQCTEDHIRHAAFTAHIITDQIENAYCSTHKLFVKCYCNTCNITLCTLCASDKKHEAHSATIKHISESTVNCAAEIAKYKQLVQQTLQTLNDKVQLMESQVEGVKLRIKEKGECVRQQVDESVGYLFAQLDKLCGPMDKKTEEMAVKQVQLMQVIEQLSSRDKIDIRKFITLKNTARTAITSGQELAKSDENDLPRFLPEDDVTVTVGQLLGPNEHDITEGQDDEIHVYVDNIPKETNDEALKQMFKDYKSTVHVKVVKLGCRKIGMVSLKDKNEATLVVRQLNGKTVSGNVLNVGCMQQKGDITGDATEEAASKEEDVLPTKNNLFVKNIDHRVDDERLKQEFEIYGDIISAKIQCDAKGVPKGFGFVCFKTDEAASVAMTKMDGKKILSKNLYVALHQNKEERKAMLAKGRRQQTKEDAGTSRSPPPAAVPQAYPQSPPQAAGRGYPPPLMAHHVQHHPGLPFAYQRAPVMVRPGMQPGMAYPPPIQGMPRGRSGYPAPMPSAPASSPGQEEAGGAQGSIVEPEKGRRRRSSTPSRKKNADKKVIGAASKQKHEFGELQSKLDDNKEVRQIAEGLRPQIQQSHPKLADDIINVLIQRDKEDLLDMLLSRNKLMASVDLIVAALKHR